MRNERWAVWWTRPSPRSAFTVGAVLCAGAGAVVRGDGAGPLAQDAVIDLQGGWHGPPPPRRPGNPWALIPRRDKNQMLRRLLHHRGARVSGELALPVSLSLDRGCAEQPPMTERG